MISISNPLRDERRYQNLNFKQTKTTINYNIECSIQVNLRQNV